jgi:hypothetical protein
LNHFIGNVEISRAQEKNTNLIPDFLNNKYFLNMINLHFITHFNLLFFMQLFKYLVHLLLQNCIKYFLEAPRSIKNNKINFLNK